MAQPDLCRDVELAGDRKHHTDAEGPRKGRRAIVEVGRIEYDVRLRRRELDIDVIDETGAKRHLAENAQVADPPPGNTAGCQVEIEALIVRVLTVQARRPQIAQPNRSASPVARRRCRAVRSAR